MKQSKCSVYNCRKSIIARGWCDTHYKRWQVHGDVTKGHKYQSAGIPLDLYGRWRSMNRRCYEPNVGGYKDYGGRGIKVCNRWRKSYVAFLEDMGLPPSPAYSLDRIDNNGNYEPSNCRWATVKTQNNNKRGVRKLTFEGKTMSVTLWAEHLGIARDTLYQRLRVGWPIEAVLTAKKNILYLRKQGKGTEEIDLG